MLNVSRMPTIRPGSHRLLRVKLDLLTSRTTKETNLVEFLCISYDFFIKLSIFVLDGCCERLGSDVNNYYTSMTYPTMKSMHTLSK